MARIRGRLGLAAVILALAVPASGAGVMAAGPAALDVSILVQPGSPCVDITAIASEDANVTLSQWRAGADPEVDPPLATVSATAHLALPVPLCVHDVHPDDILRVEQGVSARDFSVPDLVVIVDLPNDRLTGIAPSTATEPVVSFSRRIGGIPVVTQSGSVPYTDDTLFTASPTFDLRRGDTASVDWFDGAHMTVRAVRSTATVTVRAGRTRVRFTGPPGSLQSAELRAPDGTLRATTTCRVQDNLLPCDATFRRHGDPVAVRAGDRVRTASSRGTVRTTAAAHPVADLRTSPGILTASCPGKGRWLLIVNSTVRGAGVTPASGRIRASIAAWGGPKTTATLACDDIRGFGQLFRAKLITGS